MQLTSSTRTTLRSHNESVREAAAEALVAHRASHPLGWTTPMDEQGAQFVAGRLLDEVAAGTIGRDEIRAMVLTLHYLDTALLSGTDTLHLQAVLRSLTSPRRRPDAEYLTNALRSLSQTAMGCLTAACNRRARQLPGLLQVEFNASEVELVAAIPGQFCVRYLISVDGILTLAEDQTLSAIIDAVRDGFDCFTTHTLDEIREYAADACTCAE